MGFKSNLVEFYDIKNLVELMYDFCWICINWVFGWLRFGEIIDN